MPERKEVGTTALRNYPFTTVALPQTEVLKLLTERSISVFDRNCEAISKSLSPETPDYALISDRIKSLKGRYGELFTPGGFSITGEEIDYLYRKMGTSSYEQIMQEFMGNIFPKYLDRDSSPRNPGNMCVGYILDVSRMINSEIAKFKDCVEIIASIIRRASTRFDPFTFGVILDDAIHLRGTVEIPFDLLIDSEGAEQIKDAYLLATNPGEKRDFHRGLSISRNELHIENRGFSIN